MFDAVCAQCGANCQVPFRPNGRKEVFCSKCFETNGGGSSRDSFGGDSRNSRDSRGSRDTSSTYFADKQMFSAVCDGCGENCKIPFEPRNGKPVYCSNCFAKQNGGDSRPARFNDSSYSKPAYVPRTAPVAGNSIDLEAINVKLDKIIRLLTPKETAKAEAKEEAKEMTSKIVEEIEANSGKKIVHTKKRKVASKKVSEVKE
jgi:CxxC-x17-CxxC domain-containing protein